MAVYVLLLLSVPIWNYYIKDRKIFVSIIATEVFLILALRAETLGVDIIGYKAGYEYISSLDFLDMLSRLRLFTAATLEWPYVYESGYVIVNWLFSHLGFSFRVFLIVYAAFFSITTGYFIYKYSEIPWMSFCIFLSMSFFSYAFGILRQTIATCVLLWSVQYMLEDKKKICYALIFVAFLIHRASLIFATVFALAWWSKLKIRRIHYARYMLAEVAFLIVSPLVYQWIVSPVMGLLGKPVYSDFSFAWNNMFLAMMVIMVVVYFTVKFNELTSIDTLSVYALLVAILCEILGMNQSGFARLMVIPFFFIIILIPNTMKKYPNQKLVQGVMPLFFMCLMAFMLYELSGSALDPYIPFWAVQQ